MGQYVVSQLIKAMLKKRIQVDGSNVLLMGITFKENCPDLRNTKIIDIVSELKDYNINVDIYDPWVSEKDVMNEYCLGLTNSPDQEKYDAVIVAVAHNEFIEMGSDGIRSYLDRRRIAL